MKHVMKHDNMTSKLQANKRNFVCLLVSNLLVCGRDLDQVLAMDIEFLYAYHERELIRAKKQLRVTLFFFGGGTRPCLVSTLASIGDAYIASCENQVTIAY